ncbi:peroxisomal membrane protein pex14 [Rhizophlyctis rosea]|uniref:Peroxisomal membrane protein PEX14 n=1 Tax=Rhizophlyctis rosea TaxID=64517 RepID=A0AAD5S7A3_9FUNG|nr:peroxisomal membrane protein pex14 [Rhizophlyctis rosea]
MSSTTQPREDIIQNAVRFLKDPNVQKSPLAKRVAFLETKGLTADEIEQALSRANAGDGSTTPSSASPAAVAGAQAPPPPPPPGYAPYPYPYPPPLPPHQTGWKDIALATAGVVGLGYAAYLGFKRYVSPHLTFPNSTTVTEDTARIDRQITASSKALEAVHADNQQLSSTVDAHTTKVNASLEEMRSILTELKEAESKGDEDLKAIKEDVEGLRVMIPKVLNTTKEAQTTVITDLQNEIKSLKSLLINRRIPNPTTPTTTTTNPAPLSPNVTATEDTKESAVRSPRPKLPNFGKSGIPAWQLEAEGKKAAAGGVGQEQGDGGEVKKAEE